MKRFFSRMSRLLLSAALISQLASCGADIPGSDDGRTGAIALRLSTNATVNVPSVGTRASETLLVPDVEDFTISLSGPSSGTWTGLSSFPSGDSFAVGSYNITAFHGTKGSEGFNAGYYEGSADFDVHEGQVTDVQLEAALANCMVSFSYTDAFKTYFRSIQGMAEGESGQRFTYEYGDHRPVYFTPGRIRLYVQVTVPSGKSVTLQPAAIEDAQPRTHYHVTFDYNEGGIGSGTIKVSFVEQVVEETVEIDLSDELINSEPPSVRLAGSAAGSSETSPLPMLSGYAASGNPHFFVRADATVQEATVTLCEHLAENFGKSQFELVGLADNDRADLEAKGIKATGMLDGKSKVAAVYFGGIGLMLLEGEHKVTLEVKDKLTRVSDPVTVVIKTYPFKFNFTPGISDFGSDEATGTITFNGDASMIEGQLGLQASVTGSIDEAWADAQILEVSDGKLVEGEDPNSPFPAREYNVKFKLPSRTGEYYVRPTAHGRFGNVSYIEPRYPQYKLEVVNAFASYAYLRVTSEEKPELLTLLPSALRMFDKDGRNLTVLGRIPEQGIVVVGVPTPGATYNLETTLRPRSVAYSDLDAEDKQAFTLQMEAAAPVPNGDFETPGKEILLDINQGGSYKRFAAFSSMQNKIKYTLYEPNGWCTVNAKTANTAASAVNSWFVVPSSYLSGKDFSKIATVATQAGMGGRTKPFDPAIPQHGNNAAVLKNVGWDCAGTVPSEHVSAKIPDNYFNPDVADVKYSAAGKLFYGTYSFTAPDQESYNETGTAFTSRPSALTGYYKMDVSKGNPDDEGYIRLSLMSGNEVLASGEAILPEASEYTKFTIPLTYNGISTKKATVLKIFISSSSKSSGLDNDIDGETRRLKVTSEASLFVQESVGSELTIDNLMFEYTTPSNPLSVTSARAATRAAKSTRRK